MKIQTERRRKMENQNNNEREFYTLVDEEGTETEFELIGEAEYKGKTYFAMIPATGKGSAEETEDGFCEYVILRRETAEDGSDDLVSIDDDEEFDDVADIFDDMFSEEVDYDDKK